MRQRVGELASRLSTRKYAEGIFLGDQVPADDGIFAKTVPHRERPEIVKNLLSKKGFAFAPRRTLPELNFKPE